MELPISIEPDDARSSDRVVPGRPVTIWLEHGHDPMARGVVANISQGGACVWARVPLEVGEQIAMRLSFDKGLPVAAAGRIVWAGATESGTPRFGVEWTHTGPQRRRLEALIEHC